jgi:hypothetical protein
VELTAKRLELLLEVVPQATVVALLVNPQGLYAERIVPVVEDLYSNPLYGSRRPGLAGILARAWCRARVGRGQPRKAPTPIRTDLMRLEK